MSHTRHPPPPAHSQFRRSSFNADFHEPVPDTFPDSPSTASRRPLLLAGESIDWWTFKNDVDEITKLLGGTKPAQYWRWSILSWLGEHGWAREDVAFRAGLSGKIQRLLGDLEYVSREERVGPNRNRFFFSGRVPPLQELTVGLPVSDAARRLNKYRSSFEWFPWTASQYVLQTAEAVHTKVVSEYSTPQQLINAYHDNYDDAVRGFGSSVQSACEQLDHKIDSHWSTLVFEQQWYAIAIFKVLSNLLPSVQSSRIHHDLLSLWIPTPDQALQAIRAVGQKAFAEFIKSHDLNPSSQTIPSSSVTSPTITSTASHLDPLYANSPLPFLDHNHGDSASRFHSLSRPFINSRMRSIYGI